MQKLITYLKNGKGRGLMAMLVFSALATLLTWGMAYPTLGVVPQMIPDIPAGIMPWIHVGFVLSVFVFMWVLYGLVLGISTLLIKIFKLKLTKGFVFRATLVTLIALFVLSILSTVIVFTLTLLGPNAVQFYPIIIMILFPVLLVVLIAFGLAEPKEGEKKK